MKALTSSLALCAVLSASGVNAALESRLGGLAVYDTDLDITWLANAQASGMVNWFQANVWATGLTVGGFSGWRLPTSDTCRGYQCTSSEMGHLFFNELHAGSNQIPTSSNLSLFNSSFLSLNYWSSLQSAGLPNYAWVFSFEQGDQFTTWKGFQNFALAVRDGDVAPVPLPAAAWLLGSGLLGLIGVARRKSA